MNTQSELPSQLTHHQPRKIFFVPVAHLLLDLLEQMNLMQAQIKTMRTSGILQNFYFPFRIINSI